MSHSNRKIFHVSLLTCPNFAEYVNLDKYGKFDQYSFVGQSPTFKLTQVITTGHCSCRLSMTCSARTWSTRNKNEKKHKLLNITKFRTTPSLFIDRRRRSTHDEGPQGYRKVLFASSTEDDYPTPRHSRIGPIHAAIFDCSVGDIQTDDIPLK